VSQNKTHRVSETGNKFIELMCQLLEDIKKYKFYLDQLIPTFRLVYSWKSGFLLSVYLVFVKRNWMNIAFNQDDSLLMHLSILLAVDETDWQWLLKMSH